MLRPEWRPLTRFFHCLRCPPPTDFTGNILNIHWQMQIWFRTKVSEKNNCDEEKTKIIQKFQFELTLLIRGKDSKNYGLSEAFISSWWLDAETDVEFVIRKVRKIANWWVTIQYHTCMLFKILIILVCRQNIIYSSHETENEQKTDSKLCSFNSLI